MYIESFHLPILAEPDNEASMNCQSSRPCSPVHSVQELHSKLSSSPPRSSPLRTGPTYTFKKGWFFLILVVIFFWIYTMYKHLLLYVL